MRTLIDVSLFVHTRRAWHGKQYFTLATIVVAWSVSLPLSLSPPHPSPFLSSSHPGPPYRLVSLAFLSLTLSIDRGAQGGPWNLGTVSHRRVPSHATNYTGHVCASPRVLLALVHVCTKREGRGWGAKLGSWSGLSSNKCLAISDIRQPDTSNLYRAPPRAPTLGKNYLDVSLAWCDCCVVAVRDRPGVMISVVLVGRELGRARVIGM